MLNLQIYRYGFLPESGTCKTAQSGQRSAVIELSVNDLPAVCPNASSSRWALHPRVFLDVVNEHEAMCPYCGTHFRLGCDVHDHEFGTVNLHQHREQNNRKVNPECRTATPRSVDSGGVQNVTADAFGNTTLELITRWLRHGRR